MAKSRLLLIIVISLLTACGTVVPPAVPISVAVTALPVLTPVSASTPEQRPAPAEEVRVSLAAGDPNKGEEIFNTVQPLAGMACATCHRADSEERLIGPGLLNINTRAITRVADQSAEEYIHNAIVQPSAYIVAGYPDIMPKNWAKALTEEQINDLMAYLLTLHTDTAGR